MIQKTKVWHKIPKKKAKVRIIKGLQRLGIGEVDGMAIVDSLKNKEEFDTWIKNIIKEK